MDFNFDLGRLEKLQAVIGGIARGAFGKSGQQRLLRPRDMQPLTRDALYDRARELAGEHVARVSGRGSRTLYSRFAEHCLLLDSAYRSLSEAALNKEFLTPGAEWLLDNYHIIQKQVQDIRRHFPRGYDRSLPKLVSGSYSGYPRVYHLVLELLNNSDSVVSSEILASFINGYQAKQPLTIGELWAVPIMLRFALIENLAALAERMVVLRAERKQAEGLVDAIVGDESKTGTQILDDLTKKVQERPDFVTAGAPYLLRRLRERGRKAALTVQWFEERLREENLEPEEVLRNEQYVLAADQISIGNSFTSLRTINYIDWKEWVESVSRMHQILHRDPAQSYHRCDFRTRDLYRRRVELLAKRSKIEEQVIADELIKFAAAGGRTSGVSHDAGSSKIEVGPQRQDQQGQQGQDDIENAGLARRRQHIGYYLVDLGRTEFEKQIGYRPNPVISAARLVRYFPLRFYLGLTLLITAALYLEVLYFGWSRGGSSVALVALALLFVVPASEVGTTIVQWLVTWFLPPHQLSKLDLEQGIPENCKTAVVVQALFPDCESVKRSVEALEVRYIGNSDPNVVFGILADFTDADTEQLPTDALILNYAEQQLEGLRARHPSGRFFLLFRKRLWNPSERCFMGWERKRGKIEEFNRLLLGLGETSFILSADLTPLIQDVKYIITLDNDSQLPRGVVQKLVGTIAHPLNAPVIDRNQGRVIAGFGVIQPRMAVTLESANASRFAAIFSGHAGLDPYTQTVSEVYQDLFNEGSFIGKGIYDLQAFHQALAGRVPENALLSHDLFEGNHVRVALASDIELYDDFPARYHVHARRLHRWTRGDWQLLPWLPAEVPDSARKKIPTGMSVLGRYKLFDNLRRSLVAPSLFLLFVAGLFVLPGAPAYWVALVVAIAIVPVYLNIAQAFLIPARGLSITSHVWGVGRDLVLMSKRAVLTLALLPYQAYLMLHGITITLYRLFVRRSQLLDWETALASEKRLGSSLTSYFREMAGGFVASLAVALGVLLFEPSLTLLTAPFLLLWLSAPILTKTISEPIPTESYEVSEQDRDYLTKIAWRTWRYFRQHLCAEHNYLIPDNLQLVPDRVLAPRTSPTNVSLSVLSVISAYDFGFVSLPHCVERIKNVFDSLAKLERYRGHFLNWYSTRTLDPLLPRYVSMVDSGNLAGHLIACRVVFEEFYDSPLVTQRHFEHIRRLIREASISAANLTPDSRRAALREIEALDTLLSRPITDIAGLIVALKQVRQVEDRLPEIATNAAGEKPEVIDRLLMLDEEVGEITRVLSYYSWVEPFEQLRSWFGQCGFTERMEKVGALLSSPFHSVRKLNELKIVLQELTVAARGKEEASGGKVSDEVRQLVSGFEREVERSLAPVQEIGQHLDSLIKQCSAITAEIDFTFLYDSDRELFAIGYDISNARRDASYYDLLASEARLGSFVAIALGQIPQKHWFALGRPLTEASGGKSLISWGGTMFEYLMPNLMTKSFPGTLLAETYAAAVRTQINYGKKLGVPWGISESGYGGVDFEKTYQYHAFGVPGLGLKRGLEEDLVISPYSTVLAIPIAPGECIANARELEREGLLGEFGFYEAADYTPERLSVNEKRHIVQSFFAHHQGMSLVCLNNFLHSGVFQERFHSDQAVRATELLLQERFPDRVPLIIPHTAHLFPLEREREDTGHFALQSYNTPHTEMPLTHLISNGHYAVMMDNAGSGFSVFDRELMLTRWREDATSNSLGQYLFVKDLETSKTWSATYQPTRVEPESYEVFFGPDKIEFKRTDNEIFLRLEVTVSPEDNVEVRRFTLSNLSSRRRMLELTSYGEVVLTSPRADAAHPAFAKMFIESEFLGDYDALLFSRRPRSVHEERIYLLHMVTQKVVWDRVRFESSRFKFIGRGNTLTEAQVIQGGKDLSETAGLVLDPVMALRTKIEIEPGETQSVTFITATSKNRDEILSTAVRYKEVHHIARAFEMAWSQSGVELRNERSAANQWHLFQKLGNVLLFSSEKLRAKQDVITRNKLAQQGLWRFGIGGDFPICLVRITEPDQTKLVQELLQAHNFLRARGLVFELVILNEYPGGYLQNLQEELDYLIRSSLSGALADKRGGVFLRTTVQISEEEKDLLQTVARVVFAGLRGTLEQQLRLDDKSFQPLPGFEVATGSRTSRAPARVADRTDYWNGIGGFNRDGGGYLLEVGDQLPPLPWSNIVAGPQFGFLITETGGGYTWADNCRENRLTPWSNDPVIDPISETIYIRDTQSGLYWNPTPRPVRVKAQYEVEHRHGVSNFRTEVENIESLLSVRIGADDYVKWYTLKLKNLEAEPRTLELYFYVDWVLGVAREDSFRYIVTAFNEKGGCLTAANTYNADFAGRTSFIGASREITGFTASRTEFIGRNRDLGRPIVFEQALRAHSQLLPNPRRGFTGGTVNLSRRVGAGFDPCGVIRVAVTIEGRATEEVSFFIGQVSAAEQLVASAQRFTEPTTVQIRSSKYLSTIERLTKGVQVKTPERSFDLLMNGWLIYQVYSARLFARTGFYQSGGAWGFRDQLQDVLAFLPTDPQLTRNQIVLHASRQFPEGDVQHWWHPPSGKGVRTKISDDYLWLPFVTERYLTATGDTALLDERAPFIEGQKLGENDHEAYIVPHPAASDGSIYDHCIVALDRALTFGRHGLPYIGCGDWNDGMNEVGREGQGESVWLGWFLVLLLRRFEPIVRSRGDTERAGRYLRIAAEVNRAIEEEAWDGAWYRRAYFDDGTPLGSVANDECQIDSLAQTWGIISDAADPVRAKQALESAYQRLVDRDVGVIKLLTPPFDKGTLKPGYIKGYLPGIRENGGQYTHAAAWMVLAYAQLGYGSRAYELFKLINPIEHTATPERVKRYQGEPFAFCGDVYAVAPHEGRAGWSWYTGSAGWMYQAGLEQIIGLKVRADHFQVEPCVPSSWKSFSLTYQRKGVTYLVQVQNENGVERGVKQVLVNGTPAMDGRILDSSFASGDEVRVEVVMG